MNIIKRKTLIDFWKNHPDSENALKAWFSEVKKSEWQSTSDIKKTTGLLILLQGTV